VSDAASSVGGPAAAAGDVVAAPEDDLFHSDPRLRHIGTRRRDVADAEEVFDASATDGDREWAAAAGGGVRRRCIGLVVAVVSSTHDSELQSFMSSLAATHGILPA